MEVNDIKYFPSFGQWYVNGQVTINTAVLFEDGKKRYCDGKTFRAHSILELMLSNEFEYSLSRQSQSCNISMPCLETDEATDCACFAGIALK